MKTSEFEMILETFRGDKNIFLHMNSTIQANEASRVAQRVNVCFEQLCWNRCCPLIVARRGKMVDEDNGTELVVKRRLLLLGIRIRNLRDL